MWEVTDNKEHKENVRSETMLSMLLSRQGKMVKSCSNQQKGMEGKETECVQQRTEMPGLEMKNKQTIQNQCHNKFFSWCTFYLSVPKGGGQTIHYHKLIHRSREEVCLHHIRENKWRKYQIQDTWTCLVAHLMSAPSGESSVTPTRLRYRMVWGISWSCEEGELLPPTPVTTFTSWVWVTLCPIQECLHIERSCYSYSSHEAYLTLASINFSIFCSSPSKSAALDFFFLHTKMSHYYWLNLSHKYKGNNLWNNTTRNAAQTGHDKKEQDVKMSHLQETRASGGHKPAQGTINIQRETHTVQSCNTYLVVTLSFIRKGFWGTLLHWESDQRWNLKNIGSVYFTNCTKDI